MNPLADWDSRDRRSEQRIATPRVLLLAIAVALSAGTTGHAQNIEDAIALHLNGEFDRALEAYAVVAAATEASQPNVAAAAFTNTCAIRMNRSEYELALAACEQALRLRRVTQDLPRTARTLNNLGLTLHNLGRYGDARERYLEAIEINRSVGEWESVAQNLLNLSGVEIQAGDYGDALERVAAVVELTEEHPDASWGPTQRRIAHLNEGVALEKLGAYREALGSYRQALDEGGSADEGLDALLTANLGVIYRNLGDPVRAIELFESAAAVYRRLGNTSGLSNALLNLALARHLNLAQPASAERAYREALELAESAGDLPEEIQDLFYLGTLLLEQGRLGEAEELFGRALSKAEASGSAEGRWSALYGLGRVAVAAGDSGRASDHFDRALETIEGVRRPTHARQSPRALLRRQTTDLRSGHPLGGSISISPIARFGNRRRRAIVRAGSASQGAGAPRCARRVGRHAIAHGNRDRDRPARRRSAARILRRRRSAPALVSRAPARAGAVGPGRCARRARRRAPRPSGAGRVEASCRS